MPGDDPNLAPLFFMAGMQ
jgi:hypothetical protein